VLAGLRQEIDQDGCVHGRNDTLPGMNEPAPCSSEEDQPVAAWLQLGARDGCHGGRLRHYHTQSEGACRDLCICPHRPSGREVEVRWRQVIQLYSCLLKTYRYVQTKWLTLNNELLQSHQFHRTRGHFWCTGFLHCSYVVPIPGHFAVREMTVL
jgi:hypothetical protein